MHVTLVMEADEQGHRAFFLQAVLRDLDLVHSVTVVDESGGTFAGCQTSRKGRPET